MLFNVTQTHRAGVKLNREEILATPATPGQLIIHDWQQGGAENRALRVAYFKHPTMQFHPDLLPPLFDPVLVRMAGKGFLLVGWLVLIGEEGERKEVKQGWFLTTYA